MSDRYFYMRQYYLDHKAECNARCKAHRKKLCTDQRNLAMRFALQNWMDDQGYKLRWLQRQLGCGENHARSLWYGLTYIRAEEFRGVPELYELMKKTEEAFTQ